MQSNNQANVIAGLESRGWTFANWIPAQPDADNQPAEGTEDLQTAVMVRRYSRHGREYCEVEPDGTIAGR